MSKVVTFGEIMLRLAPAAITASYRRIPMAQPMAEGKRTFPYLWRILVWIPNL